MLSAGVVRATGRHSDEILELADGAERKRTEVSGVEWESETREEVGVYFFCSADSMNALVSVRTSASCPRNKWPPRLTLTSRAPGIRRAASLSTVAAGLYGSSIARMMSVRTRTF